MTKEIRSHWPLTIFSGLSSLLALFLPLLLVRILPANAMGAYKIFFLYLNLAPWLMLTSGMTNGLYFWASKPNAIRYFQVSWTLNVLWVSILSAIALVFAPHVYLGFLFCAGSFVLLLGGFFEDASIALGATWRGALFTSGFDILKTLLMMGVAYVTRDLEKVILSFIFALGLKLVVGWVWGARLEILKLNFPASKTHWREVLGYVGPVSVSALLGIMVHYADQLSLTHFVDPAYFAGYALGCLALPPLTVLEQSVNRVLIPNLNPKRGDLYRAAVAEIAWIIIPAVVGLFVFSDAIVALLFTERFLWTSPFLKLFSLNYLLNAIPFDAAARATGDSRWIFKNLLRSFIFSILIVPPLAYFFHGIGAIIGFLLSQVILRVPGIFHAKNAFQWKWKEMIPARILLFQFLLAMSLGVISAIVRPLFVSDRLWFLLSAPLFAIVYLLLHHRYKFIAKGETLEVSQVILLTQFLEVGGLERMVLSLGEEINKTKTHRATVAYYVKGDSSSSLEGAFARSGIEVYDLEGGDRFSIVRAISLVRLCLRVNARLIHTHDLGPLIYASLAKMLSAGAIRIVHTQHSFVQMSLGRKRRFYEWLFIRFADQVITVSEPLKATYGTLGVIPERVQVIPNGVAFPEQFYENQETFIFERMKLIQSLPEREQVKMQANKVWVLYLARLQAKKGQGHALRYWKSLPEEWRSKFTLVIAGQEVEPGEEARLRSLAKELSLENSVVFAGVTHFPMEWSRATDFLISLSEFEGLPLGPIEAYGAGTSLVLSNIPGHQMFMGLTGVSANLPEDWAFKTLDQRFTLKRKAFEMRSAFREQYSKAGMAQLYLEVYRRELSK